ncbi:imidazole glycerol phosphate synthase amidotransferase subunit [Cutibacterium acnes JCM 18909]|nr:imidazole glycerol phosphate synthase amidotransferase subunit [Cutibacterium acnes JCM 18909]
MSDPVRVGIIDHGSGNLHSARRALRQVGAEVIVSNDPSAYSIPTLLSSPAWER